jgi:glycosyltransferase involved in cell wall biosynthesis
MNASASLNANYREARTLRHMVESASFSSQNLLTVFVGVYNAEAYLDAVLHQLLQQDLSGCSLLVVDNQSTDNTWLELQQWLKILPVRLVRNHKNYGATGSLYLNIDLISSPWVTFMHQDDVYLPAHLSTFVNSLQGENHDVVTVSTDMGSVDLEGTQYPSPPRAAWLIPDDSKETNFLANLRLQAVPWPSTAFRTEVLLDVASAWHSSSFQDTEMMLHIAMLGKSRYLHTQTMLYRENPDSGSHELNLMEREVGAGLALMRVFSSDRFGEFASGIRAENRKFFSRAAISGIHARLGDGEICKYVQLQAAEIMAFRWGYGVGELNHLVACAYEEMGARRTVDFLQGLNQSEPLSISKIELAALYSFKPKFEPVKRAKLASTSTWQYLGITTLSKFPLPAKRHLFRLVAGFLTKNDPAHPWNYRWR